MSKDLDTIEGIDAIVDLMARQKTDSEIAAALGTTVPQVSGTIQVIQTAWAERNLSEYNARVQAALSENALLIREAWAEYEEDDSPSGKRAWFKIITDLYKTRNRLQGVDNPNPLVQNNILMPGMPGKSYEGWTPQNWLQDSEIVDGAVE